MAVRSTDVRGAGAAAGRFVERRSAARIRVPALTVLWHPDLDRVGERVRLEEVLRGHEVALTRTGPAFSAPGSTRLSPLAHPALEGIRVVFGPGDAPGELTIDTSDQEPPGGDDGVRRADVLADGVPVTARRQLGAEAVAGGVVLVLHGTTILLLHELSAIEQWEPVDFGLIGDSEALVEVRREIRRVADLEVPVLLRGETGTGKELMARAIHRRSNRRDRPYVAVNPGAIPPSLAASELFGAAKGAFTGAIRSQVGYFAKANGGTLFLDEIGEAPPEVQVMLLRVLESGEIQPLGVQETQEVDVRLVAASDEDLQSAAAEGRFRAPLFHRLAAYQVVVPPLRERRDDFGRLLLAFLRRELEALGEGDRLREEHVLQWLPTSVVARLAGHHWPGNVRQLENVARQIAIGSRGARTIRIGAQLERLLQEAVGQRKSPAAAPGERPPPSTAAPDPPAPPREYRDPSDVAEVELLEALRRHHWAIKPTAEELGVSRTSLYALIDRTPSLHKAAELSRDEILQIQEMCSGDLHAMSDHLEVSVAGLQQRMKELGIAANPDRPAGLTTT